MRKVKCYTDEFKHQVVREVLLGNLSKEGARRKYSILGKCTVLKWMRKLAPDHVQPLRVKNPVQSEVEQLRQELAQLKLGLEYERLRSEAYERMIRLAEEEFKISIRKKFGAKPSRK